MKKSWVVKAILVGALAISGLAGVLTLLWNWLVPSFSGPTISFWQALGLLVLVKFLFGGRRYGRDKHQCAWRKKFEAEWSKMTPEEQTRFKQNFTHRCRRWRWSEPEDDNTKQTDQVNAG